MTIHRPLCRDTARRTTLATALAAALTAGLAGAAGLAARSGTAFEASAVSKPATLNALHANAASSISVMTRPTQIMAVDNCEDGGPGSLRQAFADAVDGTAIDLTALTCPTITLTTGAIAATANVTVLGPGQDQLTIDGGDTDRVVNSTASLAISDLTIAHGFSDVGGGCLLVYGGLELTGITLTGCRAGDGSNAIAYGGGLYTSGSLVMRGSTITGNSALALDLARGGGAFASGDADIELSSISGNDATTGTSYSRGGGIFVLGNTTLTSSVVLENTADTTDGIAVGGGIFGNGNFITSTLSLISGNTAHSQTSFAIGAGMYGADIAMLKSTVSGNTASSECGNCTVVGGGIFANGQITAIESTVNANRALSAPASASTAGGGGMATFATGAAGAVGLMNSTVSGNIASGGENGGSGYGGGIAALHGNPFFVTNSTIAFNEASTFGGGVIGADVGGAPRLNSALIANNLAPTGADLAPSTGADPFSITGANNLVMQASVDITLPGLTLNGDPELLPLADNGGPTWTHALAATSPAIDTGSNIASSAFDQRGCPYVREQDAAADIGAFELQPPTDYLFSDSFDGVSPVCP